MNNERVKKKVIIWIVLAIICNAILIGFGIASRKSVEKQMETAQILGLDTRATASKDTLSLEDALKDRQVYFSGIEDTCVNSNTVVYLENAAENEDIYMVYQIIDKDTGAVYEITDLIPAGEHVEWEPADYLTEGEHTLIFNEMPYFAWEGSETGYVQLTQANNEVVFTVL